MVMPKADDETTLYGLLAFLGSGFASCWIDERAVERNISTADVLGIPAPSESATWESLADVERGTEDFLHLVQALDELVWETMGVSDALRDKLIQRLSKKSSPEKLMRYRIRATEENRLSPKGTTRSRYGAVLEVAEGRVRISIPGCTEEDGEWMDPPPGMPAGLCQPGSTFDVLIAEGAPPESGIYRYQPASWLDEETLLTRPAYHMASPIPLGSINTF
jgi:hypothetical protein